MQAHNVVAIFLTRRAAIVKVPALATAVRMGMVRRFNRGTSRCGAFGKVAPALRGLIFGIAHKAHTKEFALHAVSRVAQDRRGFVQNCIALQAMDRDITSTALGFNTL